MAFVARRSSDGRVVDRQPVSSRGTVRPASLSDISDEDSESVMGYTNRTYGAPTVRYVGQGDDRDAVEPQPETKSGAGGDSLDTDILEFEDFLEDHADISDSEADSIASFCKELDEEEANDALLSGRVRFTDGKPKGVDEADATAAVGQRGINQGDEAAATDTETVMNFDHDMQSLSSFDSCTPTVTQRGEDVDNLDNISNRTFFTQDDQDSISTRTFLKVDKLDGLSGRTFHKQASLKDKSKHTPSYREADQGQMSSRTYDLSNPGTNRIYDSSSMSTRSWSDMYRGALQPSDGRSKVVPSLKLADVVSESSTYYKQMPENNKERENKKSFEQWKARKAAQKQKNLLAAKMEREKREADAALRQKCAQNRFQEWCRSKEQQQVQKQKKATTSSLPGLGNLSPSTSNLGSISGSSTGPARKVQAELSEKRLNEWQQVKKVQQQLERERVRRLQDDKQKLEEKRRQISQGAWQKWMKEVDKRAKPVPLNQGLDTLRGTISNIYINPVQWVSNIDPQDAGRSR